MTTHYEPASSSATTKQTDLDGWEHDVTDRAFTSGRSMGVFRTVCGRDVVLSLKAFGRPCPACRDLATACTTREIKSQSKHHRPSFIGRLAGHCRVARS
jgi:hypothetical protein